MSTLLGDLGYLDEWAERDPDAVPSQPSPSAFPSARYRELDPVPEWARRHWRGDCGRCGRPMASAQDRRSDQRLRRCYVRVGAEGLCKACDDRKREGLDDRPVRLDPGRERRPLTEQEVTALRATVTCLGCGRTPAATEVDGHTRVRTRHRRGCPVAGISEQDP